MRNKPPFIRYMAAWPSKRIVKVRVEPANFPNSGYPYRIVSLEPSVDIVNGIFIVMDARIEGVNGFYVAGLEVVTLYKTRRGAEKAQLEELHKQYAELRRALRTAQKHYKWALKAVEDYKAFKQLNTPIFIG